MEVIEAARVLSATTRRYRFWTALAFLVCVAMMAPGCDGEAPSEDRRIDFWAMGREGEAVQSLLPEFRRRHPDIKVSVQQIPWSAAHEKLLTAFVGGRLPDVFQLGNTWLAEFVAIGALQELGACCAGAGFPVEDYFSGIFETNRIGAGLYGIPWYVDTRLLFYRTDVLWSAGVREAPRNWADWWAAMARVKASGGPTRYPILLPMDEWQMPVILALQLGSGLLRDDGRFGDFRGSAFRQAFRQYVRIFRSGWAPAEGDAGAENLYLEFGRGRVAFYVTGPWNLGEFERRLPADAAGRWATAPLPDSGENYPGVSIAGGASLVMAGTSRQQGAAWELIRFLAEPSNQVALYRRTGDLPSRQRAWDDPELAANSQLRAFREQLAHVVPLPKVPEWERIAAKIAYHAEKAVRGEVETDQALEQLDRDVDMILEKRRWLMDRQRR